MSVPIGQCNDIEIGDLVIVVGAHCGPSATHVGHPYTVSGLIYNGWHCTHCFAHFGTEKLATFKEVPPQYGCPVKFLKRVSPLEEFEGERREEEVHA